MVEDARGSSTAVSTIAIAGSSRSVGRKLRSMWVMRFCEMRWATSGTRPAAGVTTVMRASALSRLRMRPAATYMCGEGLLGRGGGI